MAKIHVALRYHISSDKKTLSIGRETLLALFPIIKKLTLPLTWVFEDHYYINDLALINDRVNDEVHISSFNNSVYPFFSKEEFDFAYDKTVKQLKEKFKNVVNVFCAPEGAFTPSMAPLLYKKGIEYLTFPYSVCGGISGFLPKFSFVQRYNPLKYCFDSVTVLVMPTSRLSDTGVNSISDMTDYIKALRREQLRDKNPQDILLILDVDFNSHHAENFIKALAGRYSVNNSDNSAFSKMDYIVWDTPYNYLKKHKAVGNLDFSEDLAFNTYGGFLKWQGTETTRLFSMLERERLLAEHICKISSISKVDLNKGLSAGLERRASLINKSFNDFQNELEKNQWNLEILLEKALSDFKQKEEVLTLFPESHYVGLEKRGFIRLKLSDKEGKKLALYEKDEELPCQEVEMDNNLELHAYVETEKSTLSLSIGESSKTSLDEKVEDNVLSVGDIVLVGDEKGNVSAFYRDQQFIDGGSFNPKITFKKRTYTGETVKLETFKNSCGGKMVRSGELFYRGHRAEFKQSFFISKELPYIYAEVSIAYPDLPADDTSVTEVMPFEIIPSLRGEEGDPITVYKQNFYNDKSNFEIDYPYFSDNKEVDAFSNAVTAGWIAVSNSDFGILVAESVSHDFSPAFVSMRLEKKGDFDRIRLNPFGVYYGYPIKNPLEQKKIPKRQKSANAFAHDFAGESLSFYLMIAPYEGGAPAEQLVADALMHAYPPFIHIERKKEV